MIHRSETITKIQDHCTMSLEHDAAHWITLRLMQIIEPCLQGEAFKDFYCEAMPIVIAGIREYSEKHDRRAARLSAIMLKKRTEEVSEIGPTEA